MAKRKPEEVWVITPKGKVKLLDFLKVWPPEKAAAVLAALERPRPPIDKARLAKGLMQVAEGRGLTSEEVIAHIKAIQEKKSRPL